MERRQHVILMIRGFLNVLYSAGAGLFRQDRSTCTGRRKKIIMLRLLLIVLYKHPIGLSMIVP